MTQLFRSLKELTTYLLSLQLIDPDGYDSWAAESKPEWVGSPQRLSSGARLLSRNRYKAVISIEGFSSNADLLINQILLWLTNRDHDFDDLGYPELDVELLDDDKADIEISIWFEDGCYATPVECPELGTASDLLYWRDKCWKLADPDPPAIVDDVVIEVIRGC